ncbi:MAG: glucosaminidase domain-containing protein [Gammaproteobacteria bacterium]|nr:glucosaminidase domain-containing protein [Gammaproteobacteria bacterium]
MKKRYYFNLICLGMTTCWLLAIVVACTEQPTAVSPTLAKISSPSKNTRRSNNADFIQFILQQANISNQKILQQRQQFQQLITQKDSLSPAQQRWLVQLARYFHVKNFSVQTANDWKILLKRVDIIPNSLTIAQAINESAWGRSRFAQQGNNFFGQWCYQPGCGIVPNQRAANKHYEVARYDNALDSVRSYMLNLNSFHVYQVLRNKRYQLRQNHQAISGLVLASTLRYYSTRRGDYVRSIRAIILRYNLTQYDNLN